MSRIAYILVLLGNLSAICFAADFGIQGSTNVIANEGSLIEIKCGLLPASTWPPEYAGKTLNCKLKQATSSATKGADFIATPDLTAVFSLTQGTPVKSVNIQTIADLKTEGAEEIKFHLSCHVGNDVDEAVLIDPCDLTIGIKDSSIQDPHFFQIVLGTNEQGTPIHDNICYDLVGKKGENYQLLTDVKLETSVNCVLRDDYYIGQVLMSTPYGLCRIDTNEINFEGRFVANWGSIKTFQTGSDLSIFIQTLNNNEVLLVVESTTRKMAIKTKREYANGKYFLNFFIEETNKEGGRAMDEHHGGVFGEAAKNTYKFITPVQSSSKVSVEINGRLVGSTIKIAPGTTYERKCYSLQLDDILYPNGLQKFRNL